MRGCSPHPFRQLNIPFPGRPGTGDGVGPFPLGDIPSRRRVGKGRRPSSPERKRRRGFCPPYRASQDLRPPSGLLLLALLPIRAALPAQLVLMALPLLLALAACHDAPPA